MEKVKYFQRKSLRVDTMSEGASVCSLSSKGSAQVKKLQKLAGGAEEIRKKRLAEENRRNRIKLALELHQQMYSELELAAICIQKYARRYMAMKTVRKLMIEKLEYERFLINVQQEIGEFWRSDHCRRHIAAYRIQRYWKGFRKTRPKLTLAKRLLKMKLALKDLQIRRELKKNQTQALHKMKKTFKYTCWKNLKQAFETWEVFQGPKSELLSESIKSESEDQPEESKENCENQIVVEILNKNEPKPSPELIRPNPFVLSEANFHKPTLASSHKRYDTPEEVPKKEKKQKKIKTLKKKVVKQPTERLVSTYEKHSEMPKRDVSATERKVQEVKPRPPLPPKYQNIQSRIKESLIRQSQRSSSFSIERKESFRVPGEKIEEDCEDVIEEKQMVVLPTLGFKQALPELYQFIESYKPSARRNPAAASTAGLVLYKLKNS